MIQLHGHHFVSNERNVNGTSYDITFRQRENIPRPLPTEDAVGPLLLPRSPYESFKISSYAKTVIAFFIADISLVRVTIKPLLLL